MDWIEALNFSQKLRKWNTAECQNVHCFDNIPTLPLNFPIPTVSPARSSREEGDKNRGDTVS
tara:strand:+ start:593 stop:778 length:186 start_codon:yes stop_codon:yes gene_type:complete